LAIPDYQALMLPLSKRAAQGEQAKRYSTGNVGRPAVQSFVGSLVGMGATKGIFVTTSKFSSEAIEYVRHLTQRVILIDGQRLTELMIEHGVGVRLNRP
jgi:restriction system protein